MKQYPLLANGSHDRARWPFNVSGQSLSCLILVMALVGCSSLPGTAVSSDREVPVAQDPAAVSPVTDPLTQELPISAQVKVGERVIQLEVAQTPQQQQIGLMNRTQLPDDRGMLFPFDPPRPIAFWMKNTLIPLDMIFLRNGQVAHIARNAAPCKADPCPTYGTPIEIDQVIELRGGRAAELGIKPGDRLEVQPLSP
ncbi:DUF192 domain-containing protein [Pantanalinema rosaneae CENA516]|uniref:DUF192 domain-containing protein n=1 Tax=Pantanalinema rosaneae TaxID=1620701 RepID=UPI003D6F65E0